MSSNGLKQKIEKYKTHNKLTEYDKHGNEIHVLHKTNSGVVEYEEWKTYDENDNLISISNNEGCVIKYDYDKHGNEIHVLHKTNSGVVEYEEWTTYDKNGNKLEYRNTHGTRRVCEYDDQNRLISKQMYRHDQLDQHMSHVIDYSDNTHTIIYGDGKITSTTFDEKGRIIRIHDTYHIYDEVFKYHENGQCSYHAFLDGDVSEFDEKGRLIHQYNLNKNLEKHYKRSYDEHDRPLVYETLNCKTIYEYYPIDEVSPNVVLTSDDDTEYDVLCDK